MTPILQLDDYFLTRLHIDFGFPAKERKIEIKSLQSSFDYDVAAHAKEPSRRMLKLRAKFQEFDGQQREVGHRVECEIVGLFSFTEATPQGKEEIVIRVNGINLLYGALRGLLTAAMGAFPGGRFILPSIMPKNIVEEVEKRRTVKNMDGVKSTEAETKKTA